MSKVHVESEYHCWNDCQMAGCPGHTAELDMQSTSESFVFHDGKGQKFYAQAPVMGTLLSMIFQLVPTQLFIENLVGTAYKTSDANSQEHINKLLGKIEGQISGGSVDEDHMLDTNNQIEIDGRWLPAIPLPLFVPKGLPLRKRMDEDNWRPQCACKRIFDTLEDYWAHIIYMNSLYSRVERDRS